MNSSRKQKVYFQRISKCKKFYNRSEACKIYMPGYSHKALNRKLFTRYFYKQQTFNIWFQVHLFQTIHCYFLWFVVRHIYIKSNLVLKNLTEISESAEQCVSVGGLNHLFSR